jgi:hypothetical protein
MPETNPPATVARAGPGVALADFAICRFMYQRMADKQTLLGGF